MTDGVGEELLRLLGRGEDRDAAQGFADGGVRAEPFGVHPGAGREVGRTGRVVLGQGAGEVTSPGTRCR
ncbi:hypothetical protein SCYAM73S_01039 [Streptomyces cyaneofuscatus]